jgi:hypothetical protein
MLAGLPYCLGRPPALDHGLDIAEQVRPIHLPPPRRVLGVGTPAIRHQIAPEPLPQEFLGYFGAARQPDNKDGDARGGGRPQLGPLPAFTPPGFVQIRRRLCLHITPCLGDG